MSDQVDARRATGWTVINVVVVLYALFPVLWILSLSLKPTSAVKDGKLIPAEVTFDVDFSDNERIHSTGNNA